MSSGRKKKRLMLERAIFEQMTAEYSLAYKMGLPHTHRWKWARASRSLAVHLWYPAMADPDWHAHYGAGAKDVLRPACWTGSVNFGTAMYRDRIGEPLDPLEVPSPHLCYRCMKRIISGEWGEVVAGWKAAQISEEDLERMREAMGKYRGTP